MKRFMILAAAGASFAALSVSPSLAQTAISSTTDLNVRAGPGSNFPIVGVLPTGDAATLDGCNDAGDWCRVTVEGTQGWASAQYLTTEVEGETVVVVQRRQAAPESIPVVTYEDEGGAGELAGAATGATIGALVGGPVGAAVGGGIGLVAGAAANPPEPRIEYVRSNPVDPVYLEGETVVGAGIPENVSLAAIPEYEYQYANVNGQQVLVDPTTRQIVYIVR
ncbi:DUF1236 domain-containing protein [Fulvimarina sp. 2208YS6-2-32]|uniref:DUF1236 domain-containing protein n=1 Tax=Fulvimarina uroteuthidis TaxID=3098149 RepID=A0ABU5HZ30_9HYPH|nr:DUF1236 domain-containing protein [Fulvimarina sp. 2208YS6-2-32]MDY8108018.1 DUF1236 domain-containing protein [Fulvimarina sp. 2208YS6-2-32]